MRSIFVITGNNTLNGTVPTNLANIESLEILVTSEFVIVIHNG